MAKQNYCPELRADILEGLIAGAKASELKEKHGLTGAQYYLQICKGSRPKRGRRVNVEKHVAKYLESQGRSPLEIKGETLRKRVAEILAVDPNGDNTPNPDCRATVPLNGETGEDLQMFSILASRLLRTQDVPDDVYRAIETAQHKVWQWVGERKAAYERKHGGK